MSSPKQSRLARGAFLASLLAATSLWAQAPAATPSPAPTKPGVPAEIVPPKPPVEPTGESTVTTTTPHLSPGTKAAVESADPNGNPVVDALSDGEVDQVIGLIRQRYIAPKAISEAAVKRATLQGLMERLGASASLIVPGKSAVAVDSPFRSETLQEKTGYLRFGSFSEANLAELDKALGQFASSGTTAVVIDLRATPSSGDFEKAAEVCRRFCPKGKVLFTLKRPDDKQAEIFTTKDDARFKGILTVLTDAATEGSAEVVAGTLRALAGAIVIGQKTRGAAAEFAELPLGNGRALRLAVAEVLLPGDLSVVPEGLKPDVPVEIAPEAEAAILAQEAEKGVAGFITETERTRLNEAALVAGTNPELDAAQAAQAAKGQRSKAPLRDPILQRAVDLITSVGIFQQGAARRK